MRYTSTGRSVAEVEAEREKAEALRESQARADYQQFEAERVARDEKLKAELAARKAKREHVHTNNSAIYHKVKRFVDSHPMITTPGVPDNSPAASLYWQNLTRPFRTNKLLSQEEHAELLDFLGRVIVKEPYRSDPSFHQAIEDLKEWDFSVW